MKIGVIIRRSIIADAEPIKVRRTASWAFPLSRNLCPGMTPRAVSSSGAPR